MDSGDGSPEPRRLQETSTGIDEYAPEGTGAPSVPEEACTAGTVAGGAEDLGGGGVPDISSAARHAPLTTRTGSRAQGARRADRAG